MTFYKVTVFDQDYHHTKYVTWVNAQSKNQAIVMGAAMAGQEKMRREFELNGRTPLTPEGLILPEVRLEPSSVDEFYEHEYEVEVTTS